MELEKESMHFRVRKNVIQLIRVNYDSGKKKGINTVVGTVRLGKPVLPPELLAELAPNEVSEFDAWLTTRHRADLMREELAALTLVDAMIEVENWFEREGATPAARQVATGVVTQWQSLRKLMLKNGLLD